MSTPNDNKNSAARIAANNRYNAKSYDKITIMVPKGQKEIIQEHAKEQGESLSAYINNAISSRMKAEDSEK